MRIALENLRGDDFFKSLILALDRLDFEPAAREKIRERLADFSDRSDPPIRKASSTKFSFEHCLKIV